MFNLLIGRAAKAIGLKVFRLLGRFLINRITGYGGDYHITLNMQIDKKVLLCYNETGSYAKAKSKGG